MTSTTARSDSLDRAQLSRPYVSVEIDEEMETLECWVPVRAA
jgi:hypothetical protein